MSDLLTIKHGIPFEREYEAWIVDGIERYFENLGKSVDVWAVSPKEEKKWPADEALSINRKIIGLQMKRTHCRTLKASTRSMDDLHWKFNNPPAQQTLLQRRDEIYYCLPTFLNRDYKLHSLSHCLFWRPHQNTNFNQGWYGRTNQSNTHSGLGNEMRWGKFIEEILECNIGKRIPSGQSTSSYVKSLIEDMREMDKQLDSHQEDVEGKATQIKQRRPKTYVTYCVSIPIDSLPIKGSNPRQN